jgi:hypothetical protein
MWSNGGMCFGRGKPDKLGNKAAAKPSKANRVEQNGHIQDCLTPYREKRENRMR